MNRLNRNVTRAFFQSEEAYHALEQRWSTLVNCKGDDCIKLGPEHHLLYAALRGKDWRRGFSPITNHRKLENGAFGSWGVLRALRRIHYGEEMDLLAPFVGLVNSDALVKLRTMLPKWVTGFEIATAYEEATDEA